MGALLKQAFHQLQAERNRVPDQLRIVVGREHAAPMGQRISDLVGHNLVDRTAGRQPGQQPGEQ